MIFEAPQITSLPDILYTLKKLKCLHHQQSHTVPSTKPPCLGSQLLSGGNDWKSCCQRTSTDCITICQSFSRERNWQLVILKNGNQASGMWQCMPILMWTDEFQPFIIPPFLTLSYPQCLSHKCTFHLNHNCYSSHVWLNILPAMRGLLLWRYVLICCQTRIIYI